MVPNFLGHPVVTSTTTSKVIFKCIHSPHSQFSLNTCAIFIHSSEEIQKVLKEQINVETVFIDQLSCLLSTYKQWKYFKSSYSFVKKQSKRVVRYIGGHHCKCSTDSSKAHYCNNTFANVLTPHNVLENSPFSQLHGLKFSFKLVNLSNSYARKQKDCEYRQYTWQCNAVCCEHYEEVNGCDTVLLLRCRHQ